MNVTTTIYRRGINWRRLPKDRSFLAWTKRHRRLVLWRDFLTGKYRVPYSDMEPMKPEDILAWADIPQLEAKP